MTIQHTVVFRLQHSPSTAAEQAFLGDGRAVLSAIPGVQEFRISRQVSAKSAMRWQFSMSFADQDAYDAYDAHPAHRSFVADRWAVEVEDFAEFDFAEFDFVAVD